MDELKVNIEKIASNSTYVEAVKKLGRANAKTLGHLPKGAFDDYAKREQILTAVDTEGNLLGYLLFANPHRKIIKIHHLCVKNECKGKGIAKLLVERLKEITTDFLDIRLVCRQDYGIDSMWERFGFTPMHEKQGKNQQGHLVTTWIYSHGHRDLFSADQSRSTKLYVVLDACVFFDLYVISSQGLDERESACLFADWVQVELELCITDEIYNEIHSRKRDGEKLRLFADKFGRITCQSQLLESTFQSLKKLLTNGNEIKISDITIRQVARTIASDEANFVVTTNDELLSYADKVHDQHGIFIVSPTELIIRLDELRREIEYQPAQLAGTKLLQRRVLLEEQKVLIDFFSSEFETNFQSRFNRMLVETDRYECLAVWDENNPIALITYDRSKKHELSVPILRVRYKALSETLARHIIYRAVTLSASENRFFTKVTDQKLDEFVVRVIQDGGFSNIEDSWLKINLNTASSALDLSTLLVTISLGLGDEYNICKLIAENLISEEISDSQYISELEKFLYPAKISDANIPNFIIPIKPIWAKELFDEGLAKQNLFGSERSELALNWEAVYYRSKRLPSKEFKAPARILWYISDDKDRGYTEKSSIRACSSLDEVIIGKPEELYFRFKRLGVYEWKDIKKLSGDNLNNEVMAIRFSNTELFDRPVPLKKIHEVLGNKAQFQSPRFLPCEAFFEIYSFGRSL
ncbi:MAG: GNAT family N-acetyltransferase [bacterium]|nr:GNAT family N-acetyltransferase [bacterium]